MKEIFYKIIEEAKNGKVIIDGDELPIGFNTIIEDERYFGDCNNSTLVIKNKDSFFDLLLQYVSLELNFKRKTIPNISDYDKVKLIITYLFANATTEDFLDPENLIMRNIGFLSDTTFEQFNDGISIDTNSFIDSKITIKNCKNSIFMETPYKMEISLTNGTDIYPLANISYGISEENGQKVCYVYSLMNKISKQENSYSKKIKRLLYKLNDGILQQESKEYLQYKNNISEYYPENISDVTPSFVLALSIFMTLLQKENIHTIKVVPYLPIRYLSRDIASSNMEDLNKKQELNARNNRIQENATDKFIRTFMRVKYHMKDLEIFSYPYDSNEFLMLSLSSKNNEFNNDILNEISNNLWNIKGKAK